MASSRSAPAPGVLAGDGQAIASEQRPRVVQHGSWVPRVISEARVLDLDAEVMTLRFRIGPLPDAEWEALFEKVVTHHDPTWGGNHFTFTDPAIIAGVVTCKMAGNLVAASRTEMRRIVDEANSHYLSRVHERVALAAFQLERARQRRRALAEAQRQLDER